MQKTNINPEIFQDMLDSASNAGAKGQSQFFTPTDWGQRLALPLPRYRGVIVDLNCGAGHILQATANKTTQQLLGADIDPCRVAVPSPLAVPPAVLAPAAKFNRVTADVTLLYPLLQEVDWRADLWALNPPWDLHLWRERLAALGESELPSVRAAFAAHDGRVPQATIDSTAAMLLIALDRCSDAGEGMLIANNATLNRLLFDPGAPHGAIAKHVWARIVIEGNPMTGIKEASFLDSFQTGVIYFARDHEAGLRVERKMFQAQDGAPEAIAAGRDAARQGARLIDSWQSHKQCLPLWQAVADEWRARVQPKRADFNLALTPDGSIRAALNLFEKSSSRILTDQAQQLYQLHGKRPMELVLQRSQRELLMRQCNVLQDGASPDGAPPGDVALPPWRVDPKLQAAVRDAVREYHGCRAPLYPLPGLQRLGYLEEEDSIECRNDLAAADGTLLYAAGKKYPLTTQSVLVTRQGWKPNLAAEMEEVEYSGSELATLITDENGQARWFMETRLRDEKVQIDGWKAQDKIEFTLLQLDEHFVIPDVPDVAALDPDKFERNLTLLSELEETINRFDQERSGPSPMPTP